MSKLANLQFTPIRENDQKKKRGRERETTYRAVQEEKSTSGTELSLDRGTERCTTHNGPQCKSEQMRMQWAHETAHSFL
jgi:hypothetical protein